MRGTRAEMKRARMPYRGVAVVERSEWYAGRRDRVDVRERVARAVA